MVKFILCWFELVEKSKFAMRKVVSDACFAKLVKEF